MAEVGSEPERTYTNEQLHSEEVTKKDILKFLQEYAGFKVLELDSLKIFIMQVKIVVNKALRTCM